MRYGSAVLAMMGIFASACAHEPTKPGERADLVSDARRTLSRMEAKDPGLSPVLAGSVAYIVFPKVGSGGLLVGGGAGSGVIFERGVPTGFATVEQVGAGAIAGGEQFAELVIIRDPWALDQVRHGRFDLGANASAVLLHTGMASKTAELEKSVAVVIEPLRGAMVNASVSGQRIHATL